MYLWGVLKLALACLLTHLLAPVESGPSWLDSCGPVVTTTAGTALGPSESNAQRAVCQPSADPILVPGGSSLVLQNLVLTANTTLIADNSTASASNTSDGSAVSRLLALPGLVQLSTATAQLVLTNVSVQCSCSWLAQLQSVVCSQLQVQQLSGLQVLPGLLFIPAWQGTQLQLNGVEFSCSSEAAVGSSDTNSQGTGLAQCAVQHVTQWAQLAAATVSLQAVAVRVIIVLDASLAIPSSAADTVLQIYRDVRLMAQLSPVSPDGLIQLSMDCLHGKVVWRVDPLRGTLTFQGLVLQDLPMGRASNMPWGSIGWGIWAVSAERCNASLQSVIVTKCTMVLPCGVIRYLRYWSQQYNSPFPTVAAAAHWVKQDPACAPGVTINMFAAKNISFDSSTWEQGGFVHQARAFGVLFKHTQMISSETQPGMPPSQCPPLDYGKLFSNPVPPFPSILWITSPAQLMQALVGSSTAQYLVLLNNMSVSAADWAAALPAASTAPGSSSNNSSSNMSGTSGAGPPSGLASVSLSRSVTLSGWPGVMTVLDWQGLADQLLLTSAASLTLRNLVIMNGAPQSAPALAQTLVKPELAPYTGPFILHRDQLSLTLQQAVQVVLWPAAFDAVKQVAGFHSMPQVPGSALPPELMVYSSALGEASFVGVDVTLLSLAAGDAALALPYPSLPPPTAASLPEASPQVIDTPTSAADKAIVAKLGLLVGLLPVFILTGVGCWAWWAQRKEQPATTAPVTDAEASLEADTRAGVQAELPSAPHDPAAGTKVNRGRRLSQLISSWSRLSNPFDSNLSRLAEPLQDPFLLQPAVRQNRGRAMRGPAASQDKELASPARGGVASRETNNYLPSSQNFLQAFKKDFQPSVSTASSVTQSTLPWTSHNIPHTSSAMSRAFNPEEQLARVEDSQYHTPKSSLSLASVAQPAAGPSRGRAGGIGMSPTEGGQEGGQGRGDADAAKHSRSRDVEQGQEAATCSVLAVRDSNDSSSSDSFDKPAAGLANLLINQVHLSESMQESMQEPGVAQQLHAMINNMQQELQQQEVEILCVIGQGAFGVVYKGTWKGLTVAVKTLVFTALPSMPVSKRQQRAMTEAAICRTMQHPNIVATYAYDLQVLHAASGGNGTMGSSQCSPAHPGPGPSLSPLEPLKHPTEFKVYIIQEFCDGGTLTAAVDGGMLEDMTADQPQPIMAHVLQLATDIAAGMAHVHSRNVVHGDLTPSNILLRAARSTLSGYVAKVADFGLSWKLTGGQEHVSNARPSTVCYIAPEVMHAGIMSKPADVFSFGMLLHEMYHGTPPWRLVKQRDAGSSRTRHADAAKAARLYPGAHSLHWAPTCPPEFRLLTEACLASNPQDRPTFFVIVEQLLALQQVLRQAASQAMGLPTPVLNTRRHSGIFLLLPGSTCPTPSPTPTAAGPGSRLSPAPARTSASLVSPPSFITAGSLSQASQVNHDPTAAADFGILPSPLSFFSLASTPDALTNFQSSHALLHTPAPSDSAIPGHPPPALLPPGQPHNQTQSGATAQYLLPSQQHNSDTRAIQQRRLHQLALPALPLAQSSSHAAQERGPGSAAGQLLPGSSTSLLAGGAQAKWRFKSDVFPAMSTAGRRVLTSRVPLTQAATSGVMQEGDLMGMRLRHKAARPSTPTLGPPSN